MCVNDVENGFSFINVWGEVGGFDKMILLLCFMLLFYVVLFFRA